MLMMAAPFVYYHERPYLDGCAVLHTPSVGTDRYRSDGARHRAILYKAYAPSQRPVFPITTPVLGYFDTNKILPNKITVYCFIKV